MPRPHPKEFRDDVVAVARRGDAPIAQIAKDFGIAYEEQKAALGKVRIAIFGLTGVGKSTLVNAVFGTDVAATGVGEPVTQGITVTRTRPGR